MQEFPVKFESVRQRAVLAHNIVMPAIAHDEVAKEWFPKIVTIPRRSNEAQGLRNGIGWNENVDIGADPGGGVAVERLGQGDALERDYRDAGLTQQTEQPGQLFRQQLVAERIGEESAFQLGLNRVRDAGESERAQVTIEQRVNRECRHVPESEATATGTRGIPESAAADRA